jgi:hypothetical protein
MSIIENSLRQEEKLGGFEPEAEDTFILDKKEYQGDLPDFSQQPEELNDTKLSEQTAEAPIADDGIAEADLIDVSTTESIWDAFNDDIDETASSKEDLEETEETQGYEKAGIEETEEEQLFSESDTEDIDDISSEIMEEPDEDDELVSEGFEDDTEEVLAAEGVLEEDDETPDTDAMTFDDEEQPPSDDEMSDEELTSFLTEELERSRKRKEGIKEQPTKSSNDAIETTAKSNFKPVDDSDDVIEIDLSSYDIDSYSKKKEKQEQKKAAPSKPKPEPKPKPAKVKKEKPPRPKKERKKLPVWLPITAAAAIILLSLSLGGYYLYYYNGVFGLFSPQDSISIAEDAILHGSDSTSASEKKDSEQEPEKDTEDIPEENTEEVKADEETNIIEEPKEEIAETSRYKRKPVSRSNKDFRNVPKVKKQSEPDDNKTTNRDQPDIIKNTKDLPFTLDENERGVFTVQIYSTLSEDDALDWLLKLRQKNIGSAFISQQKIRDKVWYRVRFGAYQTERDAKEAASKYGFAQSWIDRVK